MGQIPFKAKIVRTGKTANRWLLPQRRARPLRPLRPIIRRKIRRVRIKPRSSASHIRQVKRNLFGI